MKTVTCLIAMLLLLSGPPARAAFDAFLYLDGIPGESVDPGHPGWIDILTFSHSIQQPVLQGPAGTFSAVPSTHGAFQVSKELDQASPLLSLACCQGSVIPSATLDLQRVTPAGTIVEFYHVVFSNVFIVAQCPAGVAVDPPARPGEVVKFKYDVVTWTYTELSSDGTPLGDYVEAWDMVADLDGDGMADSFEREYGLDTGTNDAALDPDGDGLDNYGEYRAGTSPLLPNSVFRITYFRAPKPNEPGCLEWTSALERDYTIVTSPTPGGSNTVYGTISTSGTGTTSIAIDPALSNRFIRVQLQP